VVVAIIVVLAGIVIAVGRSVRESAQLRQTTAELKSLEGILRDYLLETKALPATVTDMSSFVAAVKVFPQYEKALTELPGKSYSPGVNTVKDAYGNDILFVLQSPASSSYFVSVGLNGKLGDSDDIRSNEAIR
jgi:hypothetical protein